MVQNSGIIEELLLLPLVVELNIPTSPGVIWTGHSLRRGDTSAAHVIGVSHSSISLKHTLEALLEFDDYHHHSPRGQLHVVLINN